MDLEQLRELLSRVDRSIVAAIAERHRLVEEIGEVKLRSGQPTRDYEREKEVLEAARRDAERLGASPDVAEEILRLLIRASLTHQEQARVAAEGEGGGKRALVIGGAGKMGRWFVDFLASQGFAVDVADPAGPVEGFGHFARWEDTDVSHDVIVVATTLAVSADVLERLATLSPPGLVFDIGSLKTPLVRGLRALAERGCRVTSIHPMFGPDTRLLSGRHVIFLDVGAPEATAAARRLFASTMAERIDMDLEDHDRLIAYVLGLSHALNIVFFTALARSGETAGELAQLSSTTFDEQLAVAGKVAEENPRLYFEIQALNSYRHLPLGALADALARLTTLIETGDEGGFVALMEEGRRYLARKT